MTYPCSGGCGLVLDKPDAWCLCCWPKKPNLRPDPNPPIIEGRFKHANNSAVKTNRPSGLNKKDNR